MFLRKIRVLAEIVGFGAIVFLVINGAIGFVRNSPLATAAGVNSSVAAVPQQSAPQAIANVDAVTVQDVPPFIGYSGILKDSEGKPLTGVYSVTFRIYDNVAAEPSGAIWFEPHPTVTVRSGQFSVLLGSVVAIHQSLFTGAERYVGVQVQGYQEMQPRQKFASVPHAIVATNSRYSDRATNADHADRSTNSDRADRATNADHADRSTNSDRADRATNADRADYSTIANNLWNGGGTVNLWTSEVLMNGGAPIIMGRFENVGNDADFYVSIGGNLNSDTWKCTATAWSTYYDIQEDNANYNGVWTYTDANGWWKAYVQFSSHNDNEDPDVDILCIRNAMLYYEGNTGLLHGD